MMMIRFTSLSRSAIRPYCKNVVWKSTATSSVCPVTGTMTSSLKTDDQHSIQFTRIPALPVVGSMWTSYSGTPEMHESTTYHSWPTLRKTFGDFYAVGIPGLGPDIYGTTYVLQDPQEFMKVIRREHKTEPNSIVERQWALKALFSDLGSAVDIFGRGEPWKRIRSFLQTDLFSPQSAARYIPNIIQAAEHASQGAPSHADKMNNFLNRASFDMFNVIMFGEKTRIADPTFASSRNDVEFAKSVAKFLSSNTKIVMSMSTFVLKNYFGISNRLYQTAEENYQISRGIGAGKIKDFCQRRAQGKLTTEEQESYLHHALIRQEAQDDISLEEAKNIALMMLSASVDTTAGMTAWHVLHAALHPDVQERIYQEELEPHLVNGRLTADAVSSTNAPYLHAFIRESQRMSPPVPVIGLRYTAEDIEVHGTTIPAGSLVGFDAFSQGMDPDFLEDPERFSPERWLPEAVEARKGTKAQRLDHPLFNGPFSQGARRCPGSRVARNEALIMLAQLIVDWKMTIPDKSIQTWRDVPTVLETVHVPKIPEISFEKRV